MSVMHHHHLVPGSTHTLELRQVAEINAAMAAGGARPTAADLDVDDVPCGAEDAPLRRLVMEGSPSFPYLYGRFAHHGAGEVHGAVLHTDNLRTLSRMLSLHHHWGL
jgi:hypothetical protein